MGNYYELWGFAGVVVVGSSITIPTFEGRILVDRIVCLMVPIETINGRLIKMFALIDIHDKWIKRYEFRSDFGWWVYFGLEYQQKNERKAI